MLSIVCPTLNCATVLPRLIDSIMCQTCKDYELLLIDGASTDGTLDIIKGTAKAHPDSVRYISEADSGIYQAMNKGIRMAHGEWLCFIGADDKLNNPDSITLLQSYLNEQADVILCDVMLPMHGRCRSRLSGMTYLHNTLHHQGMIYSRRMFQQRLFDEQYRILSDYDLNLSLWKEGCRFVFADVVFAWHGPEGISGKPTFRLYQEEINIRNKYLHSMPLKGLLALFSLLKYTYKNLCRSYHS